MRQPTESTETRSRKRRILPDPNRPQLRSIDLMARWGKSRMTLYVWRKKGLLPAPTRLGPNSYAWPLEVIQEIERKRASA